MEPIEPIPFHAALQLSARSVLVVGGADEARDKVPRLLASGARVTVVAAEVLPELRALALRGALTWFARSVQPTDLHGVQLVMLTEPDPVLAAQLRALKAQYPFWLCAVDQPTFSDLFLVSTFDRGPVHIAVSTGGQAPLLARRIRMSLECGFDEHFAVFARKFANLRARLRTLPKQRRKEQLESALNGFAIEVRVRYPAGNPFGEGTPDGSGEPT